MTATRKRTISVTVPVALDDVVADLVRDRKLVLEDVNEVDGIVTLIAAPKA